MKNCRNQVVSSYLIIIRITKYMVLVFILLFTSLTFGQSKKIEIYFLADTLNVSKENQILETGTEGPARYYSFFCKCMSDYQNMNVTFAYIFPNRKDNIEIHSVKPNVSFISWKSLSEIFSKTGNKFDDHYSLFITEALPEDKYRSMKVELVNYKRNETQASKTYE